MTKVKNMMKKMLVLGEAAVGKTSLIRRFVLDRFDDKYIATIGTKTTAKVIEIPMDNELIKLKLQIWDILGQRGYSKLHKSSFRGTSGVFMVADITRKETLHSLEKYWIPKMQNIVGKIPFIILANKCDLLKKAEFSRDELKELATRYKVPFYQSSAKSGENVKQAFHTLGAYIISPKRVEPTMIAKPTIIHPRLLFGSEKGEITRLIDRIIDDFCEEYADLEDAMPIIRRQIELAELDLNNPSLEALIRVVDRLAIVEMSFKKRQDAKMDHEKRLKWIEEIKK
ncbi:MAG: GTP-binding protein [Thermoplasmata archaeon]|nr:MAG: GTP-binding protein [Thermoplasmata archaeon]